MKRLVQISGVVVVLCLAIMVLLHGNAGSDAEQGELDVKLFVNDVGIPCEVKFNPEEGYAELPILATVEALGYSISYTDEDTAEVDVDGKAFVVDLANGAVIEKGDPYHYDLVISTPGETFFYHEARDGDVYVDQQTLRTVFMFMKIPFSVRVDFPNESVFIYKRSYVD